MLLPEAIAPEQLYSWDLKVLAEVFNYFLYYTDFAGLAIERTGRNHLGISLWECRGEMCRLWYCGAISSHALPRDKSSLGTKMCISAENSELWNDLSLTILGLNVRKRANDLLGETKDAWNF